MTSGIMDPKIEEEIRKEFLASIQGKDFLQFPRSDRRIITGRIVRDIIDSKNIILSLDELEAVSSRFDEDSFDMGPISLLLRDPEITEIMVNGPRNIYIEKHGKITREPVHFKDSIHIKNIVDKILGPLGLRVDEANPMVDARLGDGSRINVAISPVSKSDIAVTIRKFKHDMKNMEQLLEAGSLSREMSGFLSECVRKKINILVSGGTGAGKTTLLNILSENIQEDERIITIEETLELKFVQENMVRLEARPANLEGRGEVTIRDLVRNALRMRPDRLIVGEIRGREAIDVMQAMNTGHSGSMTTIHANSPRDAVTRLETMLLISDSNIDPFTAERIIASSLDMIIQMKKLEGGCRMISRVSEVIYNRQPKRNMDMLEIKDIACIEDPYDAGSTAVFTGYKPSFLKNGHA
jgi:pilus assembly protein CpaF